MKLTLDEGGEFVVYLTKVSSNGNYKVTPNKICLFVAISQFATIKVNMVPGGQNPN